VCCNNNGWSQWLQNVPSKCQQRSVCVVAKNIWRTRQREQGLQFLQGIIQVETGTCILRFTNTWKVKVQRKDDFREKEKIALLILYIAYVYLIQKHWERIQWIKSEIKGRLKMSSLLSHSLGLEYIFQPKGIINTEVICNQDAKLHQHFLCNQSSRFSS
jgi:hypothetical protein